MIRLWCRASMLIVQYKDYGLIPIGNYELQNARILLKLFELLAVCWLYYLFTDGLTSVLIMLFINPHSYPHNSIQDLFIMNLLQNTGDHSCNNMTILKHYELCICCPWKIRKVWYHVHNNTFAGHSNQTAEGNVSSIDEEWLSRFSRDINQSLYASEVSNDSSTLMTPSSTYEAVITGGSTFSHNISTLTNAISLNFLNIAQVKVLLLSRV